MWRPNPATNHCQHMKGVEYPENVKSCCTRFLEDAIAEKDQKLFKADRCGLYRSIRIMQCIPCEREQPLYTLLAKPTRYFFEQALEYYRVMEQRMGLDYNLVKQIKGEQLVGRVSEDEGSSNVHKFDKGIVRVCASEVLRSWAKEDPFYKGERYDMNLRYRKYHHLSWLRKPVTQYDNCGVMDWDDETLSAESSYYKEDDEVNYPSEKEEWSDAIKFLNWVGLKHMEDFNFVIIDDVSPGVGRYKNFYPKGTDVLCYSDWRSSLNLFSATRFLDRVKRADGILQVDSAFGMVTAGLAIAATVAASTLI